MTWDGRIRADARQIPLADGCVQMVCTSPPYFGLRDYSTCSCVTLRIRTHESTGIAGSQIASAGSQIASAGSADCLRCGGTGHDRTLQSHQVGLEKTPREYVETLVQVFREVWRVLKADGVVFLNLGDSYAGGKQGRADGERNGVDGFTGGQKFKGASFKQRPVPDGLKPKDLIGIPWMVAFALRADGWWLRSDIVWAKPNPMPESVTDRPTKAHEYIFLLTKSERYFYDHEAIKEPAVWGDPRSPTAAYPGKNDYREGDRPIRESVKRGGFNGKTEALADEGRNAFRAVEDWRNKRSVWSITTTPYPGSHYAVFPEEIPETCIRAGSRPGDLVLDPFFGSGTVGRVAERLNRRWVGLDLGYQDLQEKRLSGLQRELIGVRA